MVISHMNNTGRPVRFKTWRLLAKITDDTVKFLTSLGISVRCEMDPKEFDYHGHTYRFVGKRRIDIETTSEEQETMLKLKFGTDIVLVMDEIVLPNTYTTCVLGT